MMRDRTPPNYNDAPDAFGGPAEGHEESRERFTFADMWWTVAAVAFGLLAIDTFRLSLPLALLIVDAIVASIVGLWGALAVSAYKRIRGA